ncbi:MAG: penicillin-binding protein activator LpoB [Bacteroidia bacterium]
MKNLILAASLTATLILSSCGTNRRVERVSTNEVIDLSGRWNATDSRLVAEEMMKDVLTRPWLNNFRNENGGKKPVLIVGQIRNRTSEHIDATTFIKNMERAMVNDQTVTVVQSGEDRNQVRDERSDQKIFADPATAKRWAKEKGADFMLTGVISSIEDQYKKEKTVLYQVNLELTNIETNEKVWIGEKQIKKYIKN